MRSLFLEVLNNLTNTNPFGDLGIELNWTKEYGLLGKDDLIKPIIYVRYI